MSFSLDIKFKAVEIALGLEATKKHVERVNCRNRIISPYSGGFDSMGGAGGVGSDESFFGGGGEVGG